LQKFREKNIRNNIPETFSNLLSEIDTNYDDTTIVAYHNNDAWTFSFSARFRSLSILKSAVLPEEPVVVKVAEPVVEVAPVKVAEPVVEVAPVKVAEPVVEVAPVKVDEPVVEVTPVKVAEPVVEVAPVKVDEPVVEVVAPTEQVASSPVVEVVAPTTEEVVVSQ